MVKCDFICPSLNRNVFFGQNAKFSFALIHQQFTFYSLFWKSILFVNSPRAKFPSALAKAWWNYCFWPTPFLLPNKSVINFCKSLSQISDLPFLMPRSWGCDVTKANKAGQRFTLFSLSVSMVKLGHQVWTVESRFLLLCSDQSPEISPYKETWSCYPN